MIFLRGVLHHQFSHLQTLIHTHTHTLLPSGLNARVTNFDESKGTFTIDANHPLSGRSLNMDVTLQEIESLDSGKFEVVHLAAGCFWGLELAMQVCVCVNM
jgi:FKBP-type peptidyl-prolyl cis-trans isomerase 2